MAKALLRLAQRFGTQEAGMLRVNHDLTQEEIAQLVGTSRETVDKALADFVHRGWLRLEGKNVLILKSNGWPAGRADGCAGTDRLLRGHYFTRGSPN